MILAIPPILTTTRCSVGRRKSAACSAGASGAPCPPGRDIATAEIGDDRDPGRLDQTRRIGELNGVANLGSMANRLAMHTDSRNVGCRNLGGANHLTNGECTAIHQRVGGLGGAMQLVAGRSLQRVEFGREGGRERPMGPCERAPGRRAEVDEHCIDAVDAGSGHEPDVELRHVRRPDDEPLLASGRGGERRTARECQLLAQGSHECRQTPPSRSPAIGGAVGQGDGQRIALLVVDAEFVMQMRPGRPARLSDVADNVALRDTCCRASSPRRSATDARRPSSWRPQCCSIDDVAVAVLTAPRTSPCRRRRRAPACRSAPRNRRLCAHATSAGTDACVRAKSRR